MKNLIAGAMAATLLGGCQSIFGHHAALEVRPLGAELSATDSILALDEGKQALRQGAAASAIVSFRIASLAPVTAADAHNGLAIAYTMLGRGDLAEELFQQAIRENPEEAKYGANLARYYQSRDAELARAIRPSVPQMVQQDNPGREKYASQEGASEIQPASGSEEFVTSVVRSAPMTRISAQEVSIRTLATPARETSTSGRRRNPRFTKIEHVQLRSSYPIRITLSH